jgi:hypothetical protein
MRASSAGSRAASGPGGCRRDRPGPGGPCIAAQHPDQRQVGRPLHQGPVVGGRPPGQGGRGRPRVHGHGLRTRGAYGPGAGAARPTSGPGGSPPTSGPARRTRPWRRCPGCRRRLRPTWPPRPGAQQQGRGLDGPGGGHHRPGPGPPAGGPAGATASTPVARPAAAPSGPASTTTRRASAPTTSRAPAAAAVLQVGDQGRLLGPRRQPKPAPAAAGVLGAAADVAGQGPVCQPSRSRPLLQQPVAGPGRLSVLGDPEAAGRPRPARPRPRRRRRRRRPTPRPTRPAPPAGSRTRSSS